MEKKMHTLPPGCGYQIVRRIGSGGEGTVYLVCHLSTEQLRAAKILTNVHGEGRHELEMMKHFDHPSLPKIIDVLEDGEDIWLIMEYIRGRRLDQVAGHGFSRQQLIQIASQLAEAVRYLHTRREPILHLDIKPSNLLLRPDGTLVLIDFGVSIRGGRDGEAREGYGTKGFAAPEQLKKGSILDPRTDLYGIGATLYYCRFGKPPEAGSRCSGVLGGIISKCLSKDPSGRYRSSGDLCKAIHQEKAREDFFTRIFPVTGSVILVLVLFLLFFLGPGRFSDTRILPESEVAQTQIESERGEETEQETESERQEEAEPETESETEIERKTREQAEEEAIAGAAEIAHSCLLLMDQAAADGVYDREEEKEINDLLYCTWEGLDATELELLQGEPEVYGLLSYRLGLTYWYFYEGAGAKITAASWFGRALRGGGEDASWRSTAEVLARIGSYYSMLGQTSEEEVRLSMERTYWNDLKELWHLFGEQGEEPQIRMEEARELLSLEILKAYEIARGGESREEMSRILSEIESYVLEESQDHPREEGWEELMEQCRAARAALERAFWELSKEEDVWEEAESIGWLP